MVTRTRVLHQRNLAAGLALILLLSASTSAAAATLRWIRTYNGAANDTDCSGGVAVARDGSIYVTGYTNVEGQSSNLLLRKYLATGALRWMRTYNVAADSIDSGSGVAIGPDGSVYVTGRTAVAPWEPSRALLLKYSAGGALQWMRSYKGATSSTVDAYGVAVGPDGSVYVTGRTYVDGQCDNLLLLKYSARGVRQWVKTYNGAANGYDFGFGVAAGPDGSVYVTGDTYVVGQSYNLLLLKYK